MSEPKCARGECDQRIRCAFYCWWKPTTRALSYERDQYGPADRAPEDKR